MFNPSDLEGEVDHSFFDSDRDDGSISRDGGERTEKSSIPVKSSQPAHERLHAKQTEHAKVDPSPSADKTKKHLKPVKKNEAETNGQLKDEEGSRVSTCTSDEVIKNCSDAEEESKLLSKRPGGTFMALLTKTSEVDYQDDTLSPNESEEEASPSSAKHLSQNRRNKQSPKKRARNRRTRSPSPTSTEASVDADSEGSCSSSNGRGSLDSPILPWPNKSSLSPVVRKLRVDFRNVPDSHTEDSEDTVTDVSPLSSPDSSPLQSLDLNHTEAEEGNPKQQQQESVPSCGPFVIHQDEDSDQDADECSLSSMSPVGDKLVFRYPGGRSRKNFSFTNDEVRSIDRENQRLLRELSRLSPSPRPASAAGKKTCVATNSPLIRASHSALNRQREQRRIERENLAFLKRLESVKPSPGLKRSEQLADYQRHVGYVGAPSHHVCVSTSKKGTSTGKTPSGSRSTSSAHQSSRAASTSTNSSNTSVPRSKKLSAARPAWC